MPIHREITPLKNNDCFLVFDRRRKGFSFPIHFHPEYELNYISHADDAKRIVGDHVSTITSRELVLVGPNLYHGWENYHNDPKAELHEITIQFPANLYHPDILTKNILKPIRELLHNASRGILFAPETIHQVEPRLLALSSKKGFDSYIEFESLLYDLAISEDQQMLTNVSFLRQTDQPGNERIDKFYQYIKDNYQHTIRQKDVADHLNMSVISLSRLLKKRAGKSFIDFVNEIRLGIVTRLLIETNKDISEICYEAGFNNLSNFNRIFRKKQGCTPSEFRMNFNGIQNVF